MIVTVTLNPAVDLELQVGEIAFDTVIRAEQSRMDVGGKGFNVSRMLNNLSMPSRAMGFVGGKSGDRLDDGLQQAGIETQFTWIGGETRTNVSIVQADQRHHIKVNESGPTITEHEWQSLEQAVNRQLRPGDWWVLAGSLPLGLPSDVYRRLTQQIQAAGANVVLDASGEALALGCGAEPALIKPNYEEALQLLGQAHSGDKLSPEAVAEALLALGPKKVVLSNGKEGAVVATAEGTVRVASPVIRERNPIAAGDSMVAGMVYGLQQGWSLQDSVRLGVCCGAATASQPGTSLGERAQIVALLGSLGQSTLAERISG